MTVRGRRLVALGIALSLGSSQTSLADPPGQRVKTGQRKCWDQAGQSISCDATSHDGALRRGLVRGYLDEGDRTISDTQTGLVWEKLDDSNGVHDLDRTYVWTSAYAKIASLNAPPCFAGHCDWRLPNVSELRTLVDLGKKDPAVSPPFASPCGAGCSGTSCSCTAVADYWSSSSYALDPRDAWIVAFDSGATKTQRKTTACRVRAVRGG